MDGGALSAERRRSRYCTKSILVMRIVKSFPASSSVEKWIAFTLVSEKPVPQQVELPVSLTRVARSTE